MKKIKLVALAVALMLSLGGCNAADVFGYTLEDLWDDITSFGSAPRPQVSLSKEAALLEVPVEGSIEAPMVPAEKQDISVLDRIGLAFESFFDDGFGAKGALSGIDFNFGDLSLSPDIAPLRELDPEAAVPTMEPITLFEEGGVKVHANCLVQDLEGNQLLELEVNNQSAFDVNLYAANMVVNGYMLDGYLEGAFDGIKAGETATLYFVPIPLQMESKLVIGEIGLSLMILSEEETYNSTFVCIKTSALNSMKILELPTNQGLIYEKGGLAVYLIAGIADDFGTTVKLYVENKAKEDYQFMVDGGSINGLKAELTLNKNVLAGKKAYLNIWQYEGENLGRHGDEFRAVVQVGRTRAALQADPTLPHEALHQIEVMTTLENGDRHAS